MKSLNIVSLVQAKRDLSDSNFQSYIKSFGVNEKIRASELADIALLIEGLQKIGAETHDFNHFFVGFTIQQISKEFDLLRIGHNFILNIELKLESTEERIHRQLVQNAHYLRFLNVPILNFTYVTQTKTLYQLQHGELVCVKLEKLFVFLQTQQVHHNVVIEDLFDPIHYLVSPLEEPKAFMNKEYFLTAQQTTFKMEIMNRAQQKRIWLGIEGGSGTGKTLLTYDVAQEYRFAGADVVMIHCRHLQAGQIILNEQYGWRIFDIETCNFQTLLCDVLIIDEAQHLTVEQLQQIAEFEEKHAPKMIISYDPQHYFNSIEIIQQIETMVKLIRFELKVIIRYNKEIHTFINGLFDLSYPTNYKEFKHISVQYFSERKYALQYMQSIKEEQWKVVDVGGDFEIAESISGDIIGQEFDHVAAVIDHHFYYKPSLRLSTRAITSSHAQPAKVLFQVLTRTRKKLQLIIVNNEQVLENVLAILEGKELFEK